MNIQNMNAQELAALKLSIKEREEALKEERVEKEKQAMIPIIKFFAENKKILNDLVPHARNSCTRDDYTGNGFRSSVGYTDCNRCALNELIENYESCPEEPYIPFLMEFNLSFSNFK